MDNCKFFLESSGDIKFTKDYCKEVFNKDLLNTDFDSLGSWSGYKAGGSLITSIRETADNGKKTVLILDADNDFQGRLNEVTNDFNNYQVPFDIFLFPNHSDSGNLETILAEIAEKKDLMDCFLKYEDCVSNHPKKLNDSRIYSYLDMLLYPEYLDINGNDLRKEKFRNYRNKDHWNLSHAYLNPLKGFLAKYLN